MQLTEHQIAQSQFNNPSSSETLNILLFLMRKTPLKIVKILIKVIKNLFIIIYPIVLFSNING